MIVRIRTGKPIAPLDLQIAAIGVAEIQRLHPAVAPLDRQPHPEHFANIDGLDVEDWIR